MEGCLFQNVRYFLAEDVKNSAEVKNILKQGGGMREFYINELVTHIITESPPDPASLPISDVTVVKADWAIMSDKCGVLLPVKAYEPKNDKLFTGVVFCCSKLSCSDMEKLVVLTMFYGGKMQRMLDSSVTHLVTMDTSGAKYECAQKHSDVMKVITPDWILDSIDAGQRQDESLYHPTCLKLKGSHHVRTTSLSSPTLQRCNGDTTTAATGVPGHEGDGEGEKKETQSVHITSDQSEVAISENPSQSESKSESAISKKPSEEEEREGGQTAAESLLEGLVVVFSDYQDCMDEETMDKWKQVVEQHGGHVFNRYDPDQCTHLLALNKSSDLFHRALSDGKCIASAHWLNDVLTEQKMFPPSNPLHFPTAFKWLLPGAERYSMSLTNYTGDEREIVKDMFRITGVSFTGHLSRENTHLICKRPEGKKYEKALEWGIQVVNASFLAEIIHNGRVPAVLFPRHTKLGEHDEFSPSACFEATKLLRPWQSFISHYSVLHPTFVDEKITQSIFSSLPAVHSETASGAKRGRSSTDEPPAEIKKPKVESEDSDKRDNAPLIVLFTGISQSVVKNLKQIILRFGGKLTDIGRECTHIVSPRVTRTVKFLSGISVCHHVVTPEWVEECGRVGRLVDESSYILRDRDAEEMFKMNVATSLARARNKKLLMGLCFYATENVQPPFANLKEIIECAGGVLWTQEGLRSHSLSSLGNSQFIVISNPEDITAGHCSDFFKYNISVYNAELVLTGVLRQKLDFKSNRLSPIQ